MVSKRPKHKRLTADEREKLWVVYSVTHSVAEAARTAGIPYAVALRDYNRQSGGRDDWDLAARNYLQYWRKRADVGLPEKVVRVVDQAVSRIEELVSNPAFRPRGPIGTELKALLQTANLAIGKATDKQELGFDGLLRSLLDQFRKLPDAEQERVIAECERAESETKPTATGGEDQTADPKH